MPTYEYVCDACGHDFEQLQRMSDPAVRKCPKCAKLKVRRIISGGAGVIFKGSGFYETDYKRKRGGSHAGKHRDDAPAGEPKPDTPAKSDASPERNPPAKPDSTPQSKHGPKSDAKPESHRSKGDSGKKDAAKKP